MKQCLMISGGPLDLCFAKEFLKTRSYDFIIAVDAGFQACLELGIHPDLLVGDFDTFGRDRIDQYLSDPAFKIDIHKPEKDETDTELAFCHALEAGFREVDILGALGGRIDHEMSNIHMLVHALNHGLFARMYDAKNKLFVLNANVKGYHIFHRDDIYGKYVSFLPITEHVKGITLTGFKYPLFEKDISIMENPGLCVSNEVSEQQAEIVFAEGILLCVESHD
ncbi:MAG: thiamine diphosphokinase [Lachnospiraceae bacterium]|nr:thiamine diphosphokinase [Lachnospiraceae bacterium]